jgi:ribosomal protein L29
VSKRLALQALDGTNGSSSSGSDSSSSHQANMMAASIGAIATALVESPCELFRHRTQAGMSGSNFLQDMASTVRKQVAVSAG